MKKFYNGVFSASLIFSGLSAGAQCVVTMACPTNITTSNDTGNCSAIVTYAMPTATNSCNSTTTNTYNYTGALQTFTVPAGVTSINIDASGAQGGSVSTSCSATGGLGARMVGDVAVTPGEVLTIMVGQQGLTNGSDAGGGGGTFVARTGNIPLVCAGGGGGATNNIGQCGSNRNGIDATITTSGTASANGIIAGGINGNGGGASSGSGGGGGGFYTDGVAGTGLANNNGKAFVNGGAGGTGNNVDFGGYGGGGAGWFTGGNGGGGGGYSGGGTSGSQPFSGGGGGGSYNIGTNQSNTAGFQTGNGRVIISYSIAAPAYVNMVAGLPSGSAFPVGVTTVTFVATDSISATDTCSFTVTVIDAESPVFTCTQNITVSTDSVGCGTNVTYQIPVATDNCTVTTALTSGSPSGSFFSFGITQITYTATDAAGNSTTCSFDITVNDSIAPTLTCPADVNSCDTVVNGINVSVFENCSSSNVSYTLSGATTGSGSGDASGTVFNPGTTLVTYTASDASANSTSCSFNVTVNTPPTVAVSSSSSLLCLIDAPATLVGTPAGGTWSGPGVTGNNFDPNTAGAGIHTLTYSYTDSSGCSDSDTLSITVDVCTGVTSNGTLENMNVAPNPTAGALIISLGMQYVNVEMTLSQVNGQMIRKEKYTNTSAINMSMEELAVGVYILTIRADEQVKTVKVIRE